MQGMVPLRNEEEINRGGGGGGGERREILSFLDSYLNTTSFWLSRDNLTFVIMMYLVSFKYSMGSFLWVEIIRNQVH